MFDVNDDAKGEYRRIEVLTGPGPPAALVGGAEGADRRGDPGAGSARVRGGAALAGLLAAGIRLATRTMRQDLASAAGTTATPGFVPIVSEARSRRQWCNARRLPRLGSRSSLPVRWCASRPAWMMLAS